MTILGKAVNMRQNREARRKNNGETESPPVDVVAGVIHGRCCLITSDGYFFSCSSFCFWECLYMSRNARRTRIVTGAIEQEMMLGLASQTSNLYFVINVLVIELCIVAIDENLPCLLCV
ncbi:uncharacterized protein G2W53_021235 [Senna tora]|uniref:Uncharacterized protein n=1 Tax=Senna tora TaxID=362788 RepID=A0A834TLJ5_9FABA|nr:uncharacterized protein G2W53_021235 [Senna tora]